MRENKISIKAVISLFLLQKGMIDVWLSGMLPSNLESALCHKFRRKPLTD